VPGENPTRLKVAVAVCPSAELCAVMIAVWVLAIEDGAV
jgi:hypothetical protein